MISFPIEDLINKVGGRYKLVILATLRAKELATGMAPLVNVKTKRIPDIVLHEVHENKITIMAQEQSAPEAYVSENDA